MPYSLTAKSKDGFEVPSVESGSDCFATVWCYFEEENKAT